MVISLFYHKPGFHVARAKTPPRERDRASELGIAKCIIDKSLNIIAYKNSWRLWRDIICKIMCIYIAIINVCVFS